MNQPSHPESSSFAAANRSWRAIATLRCRQAHPSLLERTTGGTAATATTVACRNSENAPLGLTGASPAGKIGTRRDVSRVIEIAKGTGD